MHPSDRHDDLTSFPVIEWVASMPGMQRRLRAGARVADVGCGAGQSLIRLARAHPTSTFHGFDPDPAMIETARVASAEAGVSDRVTFEVAAAAHFPGSGYDLICAVGALEGHNAHNLARRIRRAVAAGGTWLLCDPGEGAPFLRERELDREEPPPAGPCSEQRPRSEWLRAT